MEKNKKKTIKINLYYLGGKVSLKNISVTNFKFLHTWTR